MQQWSCPAFAIIAALTASATPGSANPVDTGSQCVTALHEEASEAGPLPSRLTSLLGDKGQRLLNGRTSRSNYSAIAASFTTGSLRRSAAWPAASPCSMPAPCRSR